MAGQADTLLKTYREKRDFTRTLEPSGATDRKGRKASAPAGLAFTVQKHDATRLHYDFRVEWEGVLKSWAVTRGPSLDPADKRLAVRTEDHPLDYGDFEGTIPARQYGGGTVMLWDRGTWEPQEGTDPTKGLTEGNLKMRLLGEKMTGLWALIRMKPRAKEKRENWLLIKEKDEVAAPGTDILALDRSVKTGRDMAAIAAGDEEWLRPTHRPGSAPGDTSQTGKSAPRAAGAKAAPLIEQLDAASNPPKKDGAPARPRGKALPIPGFQPLQLATLVDEPPSGKDWLHEMKYDGYRVLIALGHGKAQLWTRNEQDWTARFGVLLPAVEALPCRSALIDGEVVAIDDRGRTDFSTLQKHLKDDGPLSCFCFDLLALDGVDLTDEPLVQRKALLETLLSQEETKTLLYSEHVVGSGEAVFKGICDAGQEGIIAKRADSRYRAGRGDDWRKVKCTRRQEFVIAGYSPSDKKGRAFSSILVGTFENGTLHYRGRVGSGFDDAALDDLKARFAGLAVAASPFASLPAPIRRSAKFLSPTLVAEIDFAEFTTDRQIRHGVFKGLRLDKEAETVTDETPKPIKTKTVKTAPSRRSKDASVCGIKLTHPERAVFAADGVTKLDLARYFEAVAPRMLAHLAGRPVSLVRCPQGSEKQCFFQKHASEGFPDAMGAVAIEEKDGGTADYLVIRDAAGLVAGVQMNAMEFHVWGSHEDHLETPDRMVFDFDPDVSLGFDDVKAAAVTCRERLQNLGLQSFAMVTGGKGVHVVVPLARRQGWEEVKAFSRGFAQGLAAEEPKRFIATMSKARRKGLIFIDWLRNERGSTAIAPYSTRARDGAPVAVPVSWDELATLDAANGFKLPDVLERLEQADPWADYGAVKQSLTQAIKAALDS